MSTAVRWVLVLLALLRSTTALWLRVQACQISTMSVMEMDTLLSVLRPTKRNYSVLWGLVQDGDCGIRRRLHLTCLKRSAQQQAELIDALQGDFRLQTLALPTDCLLRAEFANPNLQPTLARALTHLPLCDVPLREAAYAGGAGTAGSEQERGENGAAHRLHSWMEAYGGALARIDELDRQWGARWWSTRLADDAQVVQLIYDHRDLLMRGPLLKYALASLLEMDRAGAPVLSLLREWIESPVATFEGRCWAGLGLLLMEEQQESNAAAQAYMSLLTGKHEGNAIVPLVLLHVVTSKGQAAEMLGGLDDYALWDAWYILGVAGQWHLLCWLQRNDPRMIERLMAVPPRAHLHVQFSRFLGPIAAATYFRRWATDFSITSRYPALESFEAFLGSGVLPIPFATRPQAAVIRGEGTLQSLRQYLAKYLKSSCHLMAMPEGDGEGQERMVLIGIADPEATDDLMVVEPHVRHAMGILIYLQLHFPPESLARAGMTYRPSLELIQVAARHYKRSMNDLWALQVAFPLPHSSDRDRL